MSSATQNPSSANSITLERKEKITADVTIIYMEYGSLEVAGKALGVSKGTVGNVVNQEWRSINGAAPNRPVSDELFLQLEAAVTRTAKVGKTNTGVWNDNCATKCRTAIMGAARAAQQNCEVKGILAPTGAGKSTTCRHIVAQEGSNAYYLFCNSLMSQVQFLRALAENMGLKTKKINRYTLLVNICNKINTAKSPMLIILDDVSKLPPNTMPLLQTLYDMTEDKCGWLWVGLLSLREDIKHKADNDVKCFKELKRRTDDWTQLYEWQGKSKADNALKSQEINMLIDNFPFTDNDERVKIVQFLANKVDNIGTLKKIVLKAFRKGGNSYLLYDLVTSIADNIE